MTQTQDTQTPQTHCEELQADARMPADVKGPLSLGEKIKVGAKGFFKGALHYAPRGLLFAAMFLGAAWAIGSMGFDPLHVTQYGAAQFLQHGLAAMAIGGIISGGFSAYHSVQDARAEREAEMTGQTAALRRQREQAKEQAKSECPHIGEFDMGCEPHHNLPATAGRPAHSHVR